MRVVAELDEAVPLQRIGGLLHALPDQPHEPCPSTPSTCQRAELSPAGSASRSPASSASPLVRHTSSTNSVNAFPSGVALSIGNIIPIRQEPVKCGGRRMTTSLGSPS